MYHPIVPRMALDWFRQYFPCRQVSLTKKPGLFDDKTNRSQATNLSNLG